MERKEGLNICIAILLALFISAGFPVKTRAEGSLSFMAGGGVYRDNVYTGSSDFYIAPVPIAQVSYGTENVSCYLSVPNGLGVSWSSEEKGLNASASVRYGEERDSEEYSLLGIKKDHSARTKRMLADTPTASALAIYEVNLEYKALKGMVGASIAWYPTSLDYKLAGQDDRDFDGFITSLSYSIENPLTEKLLLSAMVGIEYMNRGYADAWYSVRFPTAELEAFEADRGLQDAMFSLQVTRLLSEKAGISFLGEGTLLMADAGKSPYTFEKLQLSTLLFAFYNF
jgi:outer membrane scaffolding protein for murein synthesis (MipA/OmpV family)